MNTVIADIQQKCEAFCSAIMMIDKKNKKFAPLCAKFNVEGISLDDLALSQSPEVVFTWEDTLKVYETVIVKDESDMANLEKNKSSLGRKPAQRQSKKPDPCTNFPRKRIFRRTFYNEL